MILCACPQRWCLTRCAGNGVPKTLCGLTVLGACLQAQSLDPDDPTASYMLQAGARLCKCLGEEFLPYMNVVMPPLLASAQLKPDVNVADNDSDAEETDDDEVRLRLPRTTHQAATPSAAKLGPAPRCVVQNPLVALGSLHCVSGVACLRCGMPRLITMLTPTVILRMIILT